MNYHPNCHKALQENAHFSILFSSSVFSASSTALAEEVEVPTRGQQKALPQAVDIVEWGHVVRLFGKGVDILTVEVKLVVDRFSVFEDITENSTQ